MIKTARKFRVDGQRWINRLSRSPGTNVSQGYIFRALGRSLMLENIGSKSFLRFKGKKKGHSRIEFDLRIPRSFADHIAPSGMIRKLRHSEIGSDGKLWEIDSYINLGEFMLLAEITLPTENADFKNPDWMLDDVTTFDEFRTSQLMKKVV